MGQLRTPSLETILRDFRTLRGLYILGAGASAGLVPFGKDFLRGPAVANVRGGGFAADLPKQSGLTRRSVDEFFGMNPDDRLLTVFPGRVIRPGTIDFPYREILSRQSDLYTRLHLKDALGRARFKQQQSDGYKAFQRFHPSTILNYNLDGLASELCASFHQVIAAHGTVERGYGSPQMANILRYAKESDWPAPHDNILLCAPESLDDRRLLLRLKAGMRSRPEFVAVIGYSFGRNGNTYDDWVSMCAFFRTFRRFAGNIYVIDPYPEALSRTIADAIKSDNVFGIRAYWNILAHAFLKASGDKRSLNYICQQILDTSGETALFATATPVL